MIRSARPLTLAPKQLSPPTCALFFQSEATHGISGPGVRYSSKLPDASNTALPITTSCSFNRSLWTATGNQLAREGRAFRNNGQAGSTFWTPCV